MKCSPSDALFVFVALAAAAGREAPDDKQQLKPMLGKLAELPDDIIGLERNSSG